MNFLTLAYGGATALLATGGIGAQAQEGNPSVVANVINKSQDLPSVIGDQGPNFYYMALQSEVITWTTDSSKKNNYDTCVDDSFISWARRIFKKDAVAVSLVVEIKGPQDISAINYPLFEIQKSEATKPPSCYSDVKTKTLTP